MSSREVRDLHPEVQVKWNRFHDKVRRDTSLQKAGVSVLLTCTHRPHAEQVLVHNMGHGPRTYGISAVGSDGKPASRVFEATALVYGVIMGWPDLVLAHAEASGLKYVAPCFFEG